MFNRIPPLEKHTCLHCGGRGVAENYSDPRKLLLQPDLTIDNWVALWNSRGEDSHSTARQAGLLYVVPLHDYRDWSDNFSHAGGCCDDEWPQIPPAAKLSQMMFVMLGSIEDGVSLRDAHREFMRIKEYRVAHSAERSIVQLHQVDKRRRLRD